MANYRFFLHYTETLFNYIVSLLSSVVNVLLIASILVVIFRKNIRVFGLSRFLCKQIICIVRKTVASLFSAPPHSVLNLKYFSVPCFHFLLCSNEAESNFAKKEFRYI